MLAIGYARVSTDRQADQGVSLDAQTMRIRAMATVQSAELVDVIVDGGESAKSMNRPGVRRVLAMVEAGKIDTVIVAKLDRLTRSVKDLCELLEHFERKGVALVSVAESLDTGSGRRTAGAEHHGGCVAMGAGSYRGTDPGRPSPQAQPGRKGG